DCAKAIEQYKKFIELEPSSSERPDAEGFIKDLEPCPVVKPPVKTPVKTPPIVEHPGRGKRIGAYIAGGAGFAAVAIGVGVFGRAAKSAADDVKTACADGCSWDE